MIEPTPDGADPLRPGSVPPDLPSRSAAAQRRAMQAAIAQAVRAMRSTGAGRTSGRDPGERRGGG